MPRLVVAPQGFRSALPPPLPDLIVQSVSASPASPAAGDQVVFTAVVKNQGLGPTTGNFGLLFEVDGASAAWTTDTTGPLAAGASRTLTATAGASGGNYWPAVGGAHTVRATVNDANSIPETHTSNNTLSFALSVAGATPASVYGPVGGEWPARTPLMSDPITVTVAPTAAAVNAAVAAHAGDAGKVVIGVTDGVLTAGSANPINAVAAASSRTQNILIRPVNIGGVRVSGGNLYNYCDNVTLAHFVDSAFYLSGATNVAVANWVQAATAQSKVYQCVNVEIVGLVKKNYGTSDSDCLQFQTCTNVLMRNHWLMGKTRATTGHVDIVQVIGSSGYLRFRNGAHVAPPTLNGANSSFLFGEEAQGGLPQPQIELTDMFFDQINNCCQIDLYGSGQTITMTRVNSRLKIQLRLGQSGLVQPWSDTYVPTTATDCMTQQYVFVDGNGKVVLNNPTPGVTIGAPPIPTFTPPTWWNTAWDSI